MLTLLAALLAAQSAVETPVRPVARGDRTSQIAHEQLVEKARRGGIDIYFEGDSITRRWGTSEAQYREFLDNWRRNFFGWNAADFGWGGDTVQNILKVLPPHIAHVRVGKSNATSPTATHVRT